MYLEYFGLQEKPFSLTPDPRFLFLSDSHRQALDHMLYGVREREGFILIVGDIGTGKTTICRELLEKLEDNVASALILNPMLSEQELLEAILQDFGIGTGQAGGGEDGEHKSRELFSRLDEQTQAALELNPLMPGHEVLDSILQEVAPPADGSMTKKDLIDRLNAFLLKLAGTGGNAVLIVDESQNLSPQVLEQIRILSNLETPKQKLLQIVLVGQLELKRKLEQADLRQLNQRISVRYQLGPLSTEDAKRYIEHRLFVAGSNSSVAFSDQAHEAIYEYSRGVPRLINLVCERCMLGAYVDQVKRVDRDLVERCRHSLESNLEQEGSESPVQVDGGHIQGPEAEPKEAVLEGAPEEAVDQPWERRLHRRMAAHMGWGRWAGRPAILAGLVVVIVIFAAWAVFFRAGPTEATVSRKAATAAALEAVEREITSVRLNYSIQLSAFPNLEDCRAQERLLTGNEPRQLLIGRFLRGKTAVKEPVPTPAQFYPVQGHDVCPAA
ncbi:MAG: AAA family ATPase, partial [Gemmatimonadota bacterium]|nr:AAA family ATPase [Gemmatimonadota bacterium]